MAQPGWLLASHALLVVITVVCATQLGPADALIWLLSWRSWRLTRRRMQACSSSVLRCESSGLLSVLNPDSVSVRGYRPVGVRVYPGIALVTLQTASGKPLDILIFYRYDQRLLFRRLIRYIKFHEA